MYAASSRANCFAGIVCEVASGFLARRSKPEEPAAGPRQLSAAVQQGYTQGALSAGCDDSRPLAELATKSRVEMARPQMIVGGRLFAIAMEVARAIQARGWAGSTSLRGSGVSCAVQLASSRQAVSVRKQGCMTRRVDSLPFALRAVRFFC